MKWYWYVLKNIFNYQGRARRAEFGWFYLVNFLISMGLGIVMSIVVGGATLGVFAAGAQSSDTGIAIITIITIFIYLVTFIYQIIVGLAFLSVTARRLHDLGCSGWWQLIVSIAPLLYLIAVCVVIGLPENEATAQAEAFFFAIGLGMLVFTIIGLIFAGFLFFKDGQRFTNRFGEDPKAVELANSTAAQSAVQSNAQAAQPTATSLVNKP